MVSVWHITEFSSVFHKPQSALMVELLSLFYEQTTEAAEAKLQSKIMGIRIKKRYHDSSKVVVMGFGGGA